MLLIFFLKKGDSLFHFKRLKWLQLNQKSIKHFLISSDLAKDIFKVDKIRLKFTKELLR